ncbi:MAG TPA: uroporphyrinogen decarboxylase family protein, partial [Actinomycetota bacterium]|nr:uroporphyrinogen decarboxylase family protein [Actinomycetota bacterium]
GERAVRELRDHGDVVAPLPSDLRVLRSIPAVAWLNVAHLCGRRIHFDLARELPVHAVSWSVHQAGNPGLAEGRERSGRAVMGGLDQNGALVTGPPEAVAAEAVAAIGATEGRGVLIAPGCSVPPEAPDDHMAVAATAVRDYT